MYVKFYFVCLNKIIMKHSTFQNDRDVDKQYLEFPHYS